MKWWRRRLLTEPDLVIATGDNVYLNRWYLIPENKWINVWLHQFLRDDADTAPHDHTGFSLSIKLDGFAEEELYRQLDGRLYARLPLHMRFRWRTPQCLHRIVNVQPQLVTIFIMFPPVREWGFHCRERGWRSHKEYLSTEYSDEYKGRGCG